MVHENVKMWSSFFVINFLLLKNSSNFDVTDNMIYLLTLTISGQSCHFILPKNTRKPGVFGTVVFGYKMETLAKNGSIPNK